MMRPFTVYLFSCFVFACEVNDQRDCLVQVLVAYLIGRENAIMGVIIRADVGLDERKRIP